MTIHGSWEKVMDDLTSDEESKERMIKYIDSNHI
jgi:hypothetical protein